MNINILDPCLQTLAGHYLDRDMGIARTLVQEGHDVHIYGHANAMEQIGQLVPQDIGYSRIFRIDPPWTGLTFRFPYARQLQLYRYESSVIAADLTKARPADLSIWPSLVASLLKASASIRPRTAISGVIHTPLRRFGRGLLADWAWRNAAYHTKKNGHEIRGLGAMDEALVDELMPSLGSHGLRVMARPHQSSIPVSRKGKLLTVGFFGAQRSEKGTRIVEQIADACINGDLRVILQDSNASSMEKPDESSAVRKYGFVENLAALVSQADLVVLPYESRGYVKRYSGIGGLAVSCGVPVLAPAETGIARMLQQYGTGATFRDASITEIVAAIFQIRDQYPKYAETAFEASSKWAAQHGLSRHVAELMGRAN